MLDATRLTSRKLLFVTGKGGVGKTVVTASLGQLAAQDGKKTLLVESAAQEQLAPIMGMAPVGHCETEVAPNLSVINLSPIENFREYITKYLGQKLLYEKVFIHKVVQSFIRTIPGLSEVMTLGRLFYSAELATSKYDLVIFDSSASGHFYSLMTTPDAVISSRLGGPMVKEVARVKKFLEDPAGCGTIYVTLPEELVITECLEFLPRLASASPAKVLGVFVNRVSGEKDKAKPGARKVPESLAGFMNYRYEQSRSALATLKEGMDTLEKSGLKVPAVYLPEMGLIREPLPGDFGSRLLVNLPAGGRP